MLRAVKELIIIIFVLVVIIHVCLGSISLPDVKRIAIKLKEI